MTHFRPLLLTIALLLGGNALADDLYEITQLYKKGEQAEALAQLDAYLSSLPKGAWGRNVTQARFLKGVILAEQKRTDEAIRIFARLTQDYPDLPEPYNNLAALYVAQGKYEAARDTLERALRTDPSYATLHANLSDVYAKLSSQAYERTLQAAEGRSAPVLVKELCDNYGKMASQAAGRRAATRADTDFTLLRDIQASRTAAAKPPAHVDIDEMAIAPEQPATLAPPAREKTTSSPAASSASDSKADSKKDDAGRADEQQALVKTVQNWAQAWSSKNVNGYLSHYAKDFRTPDGSSRKNWTALRRERIGKPKSIRVTVESPQVTLIDATHARITFRQSYRSDTLQTTGLKTLLMVKSNGKWLIQEERVGG